MTTTTTTTTIEDTSPPADVPPGDTAARGPGWVWMLLVVVTAAVFGRVLWNSFAPYDDPQTISENDRLNPPKFTKDGVLWYWNHAYMSLYAPLTYTVWGTIAGVSQDRSPDVPKDEYKVAPRNFHLASLALHALSVLAVYAIVRRLTKTVWPAALGALLFALHPLQVETVAWASGLKDLLAGCLGLTSIALYLRAADPASRRRAIWYAVALVCFVLAMLAKSSAMVVPVVLLVIEVWILRRALGKVTLSLGPWFLLAIPIAIVAKMSQPGAGVPTPMLWQRPIVAGASLAFYLWKLIVPTGLAFDYGWRPLEMLEKEWFYLIALVPVAIAVGLWLVRKRWPWLWASAGVFVAVLLPVLGFVPFMYQVHSTVADHYVYVAMLGPAMAVAWSSSRVRASRRGLALAAVGCVAVVLGTLSFVQLGYWRDEETTLKRTIAYNPCSALGQNNLGLYYWQHDRPVEAERAFLAATECNPDFPNAFQNLVSLYALTFEDPQRAIEAYHGFERAMATMPPEERRPYPPQGFFDAAKSAAMKGHIRHAEQFLEQAVQLDPGNARYRAALADARRMLATGSRAPATSPGTRPGTR